MPGGPSVVTEGYRRWPWLPPVPKRTAPSQTLLGASQGATLALASPPLWALAQATASLSEATQPIGMAWAASSFLGFRRRRPPQTRGASQGATLALASPPLGFSAGHS